MSHEDVSRYADIIGLPHFVSKNRKHMSNLDRAAQFAPFAALVGYDDSIREARRLTDEKVELNDRQEEILNQKFRILEEHEREHPVVTLTHFVPDQRKKGGAYEETEIRLHRVDPVERLLISSDHVRFEMDNILDLEGEIFLEYLPGEADWE